MVNKVCRRRLSIRRPLPYTLAVSYGRCGVCALSRAPAQADPSSCASRRGRSQTGAGLGAQLPSLGSVASCSQAADSVEMQLLWGQVKWSPQWVADWMGTPTSRHAPINSVPCSPRVC
jgi:hypothetical protein